MTFHVAGRSLNQLDQLMVSSPPPVCPPTFPSFFVAFITTLSLVCANQEEFPQSLFTLCRYLSSFHHYNQQLVTIFTYLPFILPPPPPLFHFFLTPMVPWFATSSEARGSPDFQVSSISSVLFFLHQNPDPIPFLLL